MTASYQMDPATKQLRMIDAMALAVCLALTAAVYFAGVRPALRQRQMGAEQRQALQEQRQEAAERSAALAQMHRRLSEAEQAVASNPLRLQPLAALNQRMAQITDLATQSGLRIERIRPRARVAGEHYHTVPIEMAGSGGFQASERFIHELHERLPDVAVRSLGLEGRPGRPDQTAPPSFYFELSWYAAPPWEAG